MADTGNVNVDTLDALSHITVEGERYFHESVVSDLAARARYAIEQWDMARDWFPDGKHIIEERDRLARRVAELEAALRVALDCKGPYNGTVSERGGDPALCVKCVDNIESALAGDGGGA